MDYYCRIGRHGQIGRFRSKGSRNLPRGARVVVRTTRGIETATVLSTAVPPSELAEEPTNKATESTVDGTVLRLMTAEDKLLDFQLKATAKETFNSLQQYLSQIDANDCLMDVEPLLDGKTLYFHFLGETSDLVSEHLKVLTKLYQTKVSESQFAKLLETGCGPQCGTEEKGGCGESGTCNVCVVAKACKSKQQLGCVHFVIFASSITECQN